MSLCKVLHIMQAGRQVYGMEKTTFSSIQYMRDSEVTNAILFIMEEQIRNIHNPVLCLAEHLRIPTQQVYSKRSWDLYLVQKVRKIISEHKPSIIHSHGNKGDVIIFLATLGMKIKRMTTIHGWLSREWKEKLHEFLDIQAIRWMDCILVHSQDYRERLIKLGINPEKLQVVPSGVTEALIPYDSNFHIREYFKIPSGDAIVGIVARLTEEKDHQTFLKAAAIVLEKIPNVTFLIVGEGMLKHKLQRMTEELGIAQKVIFTGFIAAMKNVYEAMDVLVSTSKTEGMPRNILEAMLLGKPVVATAIGGTCEVVNDGYTGFLRPVKDYRSIAEKITILIDSSTLAQQFGMAGRQRIKEEFLAEKRAKKISEIYKRLYYEE